MGLTAIVADLSLGSGSTLCGFFPWLRGIFALALGAERLAWWRLRSERMSWSWLRHYKAVS